MRGNRIPRFPLLSADHQPTQVLEEIGLMPGRVQRILCVCRRVTWCGAGDEAD
jgi:hypothetical protein